MLRAASLGGRSRHTVSFYLWVKRPFGDFEVSQKFSMKTVDRAAARQNLSLSAVRGVRPISKRLVFQALSWVPSIAVRPFLL